MISKASLSKIKVAYEIWLKENENNTFYHPYLVEELVAYNKSIQDFDQIFNKIPRIVHYRPFFYGWLKDEIDELNLRVLEKRFELGQNIKFIKSILKNTKETKSVLKSGERIELTAYGDSKLQNREVIAYTFKFTDDLLTSYDDNSDKSMDYFKLSDNPLDMMLEGSELIKFLKSNNLLDLITDKRILYELQQSYSGSGLILHLKQNALLHLVSGNATFDIIQENKKGLKFIRFIQENGFYSECPKIYFTTAVSEYLIDFNKEVEKLNKLIKSSQYFATDRATLLFKNKQLEFNKDISKSNVQEYSVPGQYLEKFYAIDEYLILFQDYFNGSKFTQEEFTKMGFSAEESSKNLNEQTNISNNIQELFGINESRSLELGASNSGPSGAWYSKKWLVYLLLILFFPMGLYGLAKNKSISGVTKFIIYGILGFLIYTAYKGNILSALNQSVATPVDSFQIDSTMGPSFIFNNKAQDTIVVAYGYKYKKGVRSVGWYQIKPESSIQFPIPSDLTNDAIYWYAESIKGMKWVGKDKKFCIDHLNSFDIKKKKTSKCVETAVFTQRLLTQTYNTIDIQ